MPSRIAIEVARKIYSASNRWKPVVEKGNKFGIIDFERTRERYIKNTAKIIDRAFDAMLDAMEDT